MKPPHIAIISCLKAVCQIIVFGIVVCTPTIYAYVMAYMKKFLLTIMFLLLSSGLWAADFPLTITDAFGRAVVFASPPRRIISLSPGATEILFAIGAGDRIVGVTRYCNYPAAAQSRTAVGGFSGITVNIETIARLRPDAVILSEFMHERLVPLLDRLAITSFAVEPQTFDEVYQTIETLGRITGSLQQAEFVIDDMKQKISRASARRGNRDRPAVFWELSDDPLMTTGGGTFISEAIHLAGGRNIFADRSEQWLTINVEQVLLRNPEWIITGDDHGKITDPRALSRRPGWSRLPAVRNNNIALIDADSIYRYGPRLADAVLSLSQTLWPASGL
jgi:iron complex transport system substrate-binding protein